METKYRGSLFAEQAEEEEHKAETEPDGEETELYELQKRASLVDFINAQTGEKPLEGASLEFKQAMKSGDGQIPLAVFAPQDESEDQKYADALTETTSTSLTRPRGFLERIFAGEAVSHLGIKPMAVPVGQEVYPVVTAGPTGGAIAKGVDREAEAMTADFTKKLSPVPVRCTDSVPPSGRTSNSRLGRRNKARHDGIRDEHDARRTDQRCG